MDHVINLLNGISAGLLLFMLSAGLTLIFSMMGVLNFAHASFYMVGAYFAYTLSKVIGFWPALVISPLLVGVVGALFERLVLRRVHRFGHVPELLITFGLSYVILELVQLVWGRTTVPFSPPTQLEGPAFTFMSSASAGFKVVWGSAPAELCNALVDASARCSPFPLTRAFMMIVSLLMLLGLWLLLTRTRVGLVIQAALTHPKMVEALGHNVPIVFMAVFGSGCALAGLAGVMGGVSFVTDPSMAVIVGSIVFVVVVVGGMGSLVGAFIGSLIVGILQTMPLSVDKSLVDLAAQIGWTVMPGSASYAVMKITLAQAAPLLPYLLLVLMLIVRPKGLLGKREA